MFKSSGTFGAESAAAASANLEAAMDDLVMREYLMARRGVSETSQQQPKKTVYIRTEEKSSNNNEEDRERNEDADEDDFDLDDIDNDPYLKALREQRIKELKAEQSKYLEDRAKGHGEYREIVEEEFLKEVTGSKLVVCHFYHSEFQRCKIVDQHLAKLAKKYFGTKFIKINAEKAMFFVNKLKIMVLPTLVFFKDGISVDRMVGFSDVGEKDTFSTVALEKRIEKSGVIKYVKDVDEDADDDTINRKKSIYAGAKGSKGYEDDDDDDF
eukprot:GEZU01031125.1.p2 GENE.GEZU01031125.1~~GEZU01031125.1.p2  ORF type:complete len:269 (+),score=102.14 GEZU01031125.1:66-872(+)